MGDGLTICEKAVIEHNMSAAARVYDNVTFSELGDLLGLPPASAERVAARMISEGRLQGSIDQVSSTLQYGEGGGVEELQQWDVRIGNVCARVNACVEAITAAHPQLVEP
jgi:COP9 signalosome complex subunit 4